MVLAGFHCCMLAFLCYFPAEIISCFTFFTLFEKIFLARSYISLMTKVYYDTEDFFAGLSSLKSNSSSVLFGWGGDKKKKLIIRQCS